MSRKGGSRGERARLARVKSDSAGASRPVVPYVQGQRFKAIRFAELQKMIKPKVEDDE